MQTVFVCGGRGSRLTPRSVGPKSLVPIGGSSLLAHLVHRIGRCHTSDAPPVVIVDDQDAETPLVVDVLLPRACVVRQARPDGVANALLLAQPFLDDVVVVALGDLFLDGEVAGLTREPALVFWREAPPAETRKNFGVTIKSDGSVSAVIEKPVHLFGLTCGMGIYVLTRSAIACFRHAPVDARTGERGITAAIQTAIDRGIVFRSVPFSGFYNNVNSPSDVASVEGHLAQAVRCV